MRCVSAAATFVEVARRPHVVVVVQVVTSAVAAVVISNNYCCCSDGYCFHCCGVSLPVSALLHSIITKGERLWMERESGNYQERGERERKSALTTSGGHHEKVV